MKTATQRQVSLVLQLRIHIGGIHGSWIIAQGVCIYYDGQDISAQGKA